MATTTTTARLRYFRTLNGYVCYCNCGACRAADPALQFGASITEAKAATRAIHRTITR